MIRELLESMPPLLGETIIPFLMLGLVIAMVMAGLKDKTDRPLPIVREAARFLVMLAVGFALFCVCLFVLGDPHLPF